MNYEGPLGKSLSCNPFYFQDSITPKRRSEVLVDTVCGPNPQLIPLRITRAGELLFLSVCEREDLVGDPGQRRAEWDKWLDVSGLLGGG